MFAARRIAYKPVRRLSVRSPDKNKVGGETNYISVPYPFPSFSQFGKVEGNFFFLQLLLIRFAQLISEFELGMPTKSRICLIRTFLEKRLFSFYQSNQNSSSFQGHHSRTRVKHKPKPSDPPIKAVRVLRSSFARRSKESKVGA